VVPGNVIHSWNLGEFCPYFSAGMLLTSAVEGQQKQKTQTKNPQNRQTWNL
jgi:hypothetical protein